MLWAVSAPSLPLFVTPCTSSARPMEEWGTSRARRAPKERYLYNLDNTDSLVQGPLSQRSIQREWSSLYSVLSCLRGFASVT
jgi:hypothetical protein